MIEMLLELLSRWLKKSGGGTGSGGQGGGSGS
jgi:hypothetical protein